MVLEHFSVQVDHHTNFQCPECCPEVAIRFTMQPLTLTRVELQFRANLLMSTLALWQFLTHKRQHFGQTT